MGLIFLKMSENSTSDLPDNELQDDEMLPEYDFSEGVRGKHFREMQSGYAVTIRHADGTSSTRIVAPEESVVVLDPDVKEYFHDSESVNRILRSLIDLIPKPHSASSE